MAKDLYAILGVPRGASDEEIRRAYRKLARRYHPDVNPGNREAEERFKEITAAYEVLSDPDKRKAYDEFGEEALRGGFDPEKARAYRAWQERRRATAPPFGGEAAEFDLGDLFTDLFGGIGDRRARGPAPGEDVIAEIEIDLAQALQGAQLEVTARVPTPCTTCGGSGDAPGTQPRTCDACGGTGRRQAIEGPLRLMVTCRACGGAGRLRTPCRACGGEGHVLKERPVTVRIPPGADDGSRLRVPGLGRPGVRGGPPGDLLLVTRVRPHPFFRREGLDLYLRLPITLDEALGGARVEVPTPDGPVTLKVPPGSQPGTRLRLKGKGVRRGDARGDLYVELDVRLPDRIDPKLVEAARAAASGYARPVREGVKL